MKIEHAVYKQQTKHLRSKVLGKCREEIGVGSITSQLREFHECHVIPAENQVSEPNQGNCDSLTSGVPFIL